MKVIDHFKRYWWIPAGILLALSLWRAHDYQVDQIIEKSNALLMVSEQKRQLKLQEIGRLRGVLEASQRDRELMRANILEMEKRLTEAKIQPPEMIKTVYVDRVEYVPKVEYQKVYDFTLNLRRMYSEYIRDDQTFEENVERIIGEYDALKIIYDHDLRDLQRTRDRLARIARRRFSLVVGPAVTVGVNGDLRFGFSLCFGYRIL